jgi:hypothetical protein
VKPHIVYVLGAGFSAPLGLPVIANFYSRSKDLYTDDRARYAHFGQVFDLVKSLAVAKNSYKTDLTNIEEILSLLEMGAFTAGGYERDVFVQYLTDVVQGLTPAPARGNVAAPGDWRSGVFSTHQTWADYAQFAACIKGLSISRDSDGIVVVNSTAIDATYSIITLNYDLVLEHAVELVRSAVGGRREAGFRIVTTRARGDEALPLVAKIHGSVEDGTIVPPTWNKGGNTDISPAWTVAREALEKANYVRFLGYSLPEADAYVRYLLKIAAVRAEHLKGIDVICVDNEERMVESRYRSFIELPTRFVSGDVGLYLNRVSMACRRLEKPNMLQVQLESAHEMFMKTAF